MGRERLHRAEFPRLEIIEDCEFPITETSVSVEGGYKVIELPPNLRALFDNGVQVLRINSLRVAQSLPDYRGRSSAEYSLLPHQDTPPGDPRRFTILSKLTEGHRDGSTLAMLPETVAAALPDVEDYFAEHRGVLGAEREYDKRFKISEEEYDRCFDTSSGLREATQKMLAGKTDARTQLFARTSLLGYLIRGPHADVVLEELLVNVKGAYISEDWGQPGVSIIDNAQVFHARRGGNNPPLKRNFGI